MEHQKVADARGQTPAAAASCVVFGLAMVAVAAVAAQVIEHSRGASGIAACALVGFVVLRAAPVSENAALVQFLAVSGAGPVECPLRSPQR